MKGTIYLVSNPTLLNSLRRKVTSTHGAIKGHSDEIQTWPECELGWEMPSENSKFLSKNMVYKKACIERPITENFDNTPNGV
jgi:hypothetical protein